MHLYHSETIKTWIVDESKLLKKPISQPLVYFLHFKMVCSKEMYVTLFNDTTSISIIQSYKKAHTLGLQDIVSHLLSLATHSYV